MNSVISKPKMLPRLLQIAAVLALSSLFIFPMWRITLTAPQYPDGITLYIWVDRLAGDQPGTLQNINILNHYVGMQAIEPDEIPELGYFPYIIGGMLLLGLITTIVDRPGWYIGWVTLLLVLCVAGLYDFYQWEYLYGHQLDPTAPIKIPGQAYQPPLIGKARILNFTAASWPSLGGILAGLSVILGIAAAFISSNNKKQAHEAAHHLLARGMRA